ncbi:nuclear transport factor 2 family protein [Reichenbachiella versicolor]|uniref:nuclear transport factor 2 family protein n=1 Tax=Reichenbachiella versicolor TaxID=1821036 RepID=UPI001C8781BF|nr:nuclear transport factor 2 family protein [Reichenbachiella versicolor]
MIIKNQKYILPMIAIMLLAGCTQNQTQMTNLEIIKSTYEGKNSEENGKNLQKHLSENVKWTEAAGFPYAGTYTGFEQIAENVFSRLGSEWIDYKFIPEDYVASDDKVVAYGTYTGIFKKTNKPFTARVAHVWKLEQSKIISFEQFVDSKVVVDSMSED